MTELPKIDYKEEVHNPIETDLLICACSSSEHQIIIKRADWGDQKWHTVQIHLTSSDSFWNRVKTGIKYIFGYKSKYGDFDEIIIEKEHVPQLRKLITHLENDN